MITQLEKLGVRVPPKIAAANAVREAVMRHASPWITYDGVSVLAEKLKAGQLTPAQAEAELLAVGEVLVLKETLKTTAQTMANACDHADAVALRESEAELIDSLRPIVEALGKQLADATNHIGSAPHKQMIDALGPAAADTFARWREADKGLQVIRVVVSPLFGRESVPPAAWVPLDAFDADALDRLVKCDGSFAKIVAAGFTLTLNASTAVKAKAAELAEVARVAAALAARR